MSKEVGRGDVLKSPYGGKPQKGAYFMGVLTSLDTMGKYQQGNFRTIYLKIQLKSHYVIIYGDTQKPPLVTKISEILFLMRM